MTTCASRLFVQVLGTLLLANSFSIGVLASDAGQTDATTQPAAQSAPLSIRSNGLKSNELATPANAEVPRNVRAFELIAPNGHLLGDWGGLRPQLKNYGITPSLTLVTDIAGNPVGGKRKGVTESSNLGLDLQFDLGKIGIKKGTFELSMSDRFGSSLTKDYIGNTFNVQQDFGGETFKIIDAAYLQTLFDDRLEFRVGRLAAGDDFFVSSYDYLFMQNGICGNPVGVFFNAPGMTAYPNANWGGWLKVKPTLRSYVVGGLYNGDPSPRENDRHGVDGSANGPLFAIIEAGYRLNGLPTDDGLVGDYKLGFWYDDSIYTDFNDEPATSGISPGKKRGNTGIYALFDQALTPFGNKASRRGLGAFGSVLISPDTSVSQLPYFFTFGVAARGPLAQRPNDAAGFAVIYGHFSDDLDREESRAGLIEPTAIRQSYETAMELTYRCFLANGGLFIQPDAQYIIHPGGTSRIPDALVLGCQIGIDF